jgi:RecB family exonuclease
MRELTDATAAVTAADEPVALSGSQLAGLLSCPRQWFLSRKGQADPARNTAATFGSVIHVLADHGARSDVPAHELAAHLEQVWDQLSFDANWLSSVERAEAEAALDRFVGWQAARPEMELLGTEVRFRVLVDLGSDRVLLTGSADRVERDPQGRIRIVDFKTSRAAPQSADVAVQDQMGVYQLAVLAGAFDELAGPGARPAGAELVYLRLGDAPTSRGGGGLLPKSFHQASLDDVPYPTDDPDDGPDRSELPPDLDLQPTWVHRRLAVAAHLVRRERFVARIGPGCRYCPFAASCPAQPVGRQVVR